MGRTLVRPVKAPASHKTRDRLVTFGAIIVLLFAVLGVVSAGIFIAGKTTHASNKHHKVTHQPSGSAVAVADVARAQAQATAIIKAAESTGNSIVKGANSKARLQAASIVSKAHKSVPASSAVVPAAPLTSGSAPAQSTTSTLAPTAVPLGTTSGGADVPNLAGVPSSWQVVGYNASFGSGPGSAGSVSVLNRGHVAFSGVAVVRYAKGGSASAPFSGLAPGQSLVLPLNGRAYSGGGYSISLTGLR